MSRPQSRPESIAPWAYDIEALADAVHECVCANTGDDGSGWCLTYAMLGCEWLRRRTNWAYEVFGGQLSVTLLDGVRFQFEHFWIQRVRKAHRLPEIIDLATRHNPAIIRNSKKVTVDAAMIPEAFGPKYYRGTGQDVAWLWRYLPMHEATQFARRQMYGIIAPGELERLNVRLARIAAAKSTS